MEKKMPIKYCLLYIAFWLVGLVIIYSFLFLFGYLLSVKIPEENKIMKEYETNSKKTTLEQSFQFPTGQGKRSILPQCKMDQGEPTVQKRTSAMCGMQKEWEDNRFSDYRPYNTQGYMPRSLGQVKLGS